MATAPSSSEPVPAGYTVVARRYRPQQFADLIGQEHVAQALSNAIVSGRVAHAYLFTGGRGMGKTTTARILAKALNCRFGPTPTPCDECDECRAITGGDDVDVIEIDGASNNGVDNIRDLRSNAGFRPQHGRFKIYIIDEVHMLSTSAFNALLKTLEEPPAHVKFILATTDAQKIPATILSRCQRFDFAAIGPAEVAAALQHIAAREGLQADPEALDLLARRANGSMRDAQTLLDQLLGAAAGRLTVATLQAVLGTAGDDRVAALAAAVLDRDAKRAVELVGEAAAAGLQLGELLDQLTDYWRGLMLVQVAGPDVRGLLGTPALREDIRTRAEGTTLDTVLAGIDVLTATKGKLRTSPHAQVLIEVAVVRMSRLDDLLSVAALVQMLAGGEAPKLPSVAPPAVAKPVVVTPSPTYGPAVVPPEGVKKNGPLTPSVVASPPPAVGSGDIAADNLPAVWGQVLDTVGMVRKEQLKMVGLPAIIGPNSLVVRFASDYSSAYESCATDATLEVLRKVLRKVTGKDVQVRVELAKPAAPPVTPARPADQPVPIERPSDLMRLPLFAKAAETLGAQLLKIDDGFDPYLVAALADDAAVALPAADVTPE